MIHDVCTPPPLQETYVPNIELFQHELVNNRLSRLPLISVIPTRSSIWRMERRSKFLVPVSSLWCFCSSAARRSSLAALCDESAYLHIR